MRRDGGKNEAVWPSVAAQCVSACVCTTVCACVLCVCTFVRVHVHVCALSEYVCMIACG